MNQSTSSFKGPLRAALIVTALLAPTAWLVQFYGAFPVPSAASSATAGVLLVGVFLAVIVAPISIFRLVRTPSFRTPISYMLTGICLVLAIIALLIGVAIIGHI